MENETLKPLTNMKWPKRVTIYTDGASRGNPGPASIGIFVIDADGAALLEHGERLGAQTNNFAEYMAVIRALELAHESGVAEVVLRSDSELMVKQMTGVYKVKSPVIQPLHQRARQLMAQFKGVKFEHVRRELNAEADRIANEALDRP
jgi:ribonuclease HI